MKQVVVFSLSLALLSPAFAADTLGPKMVKTPKSEALITPQPYASGETPGLLPNLEVPGGLEAWHDYWSANITREVDYFDSFFGDERLKDDNKSTRVQLGLGVSYSGEDGPQFEGDFSARLSLPNLENRWQIIVDSAMDVDDPQDFGNMEDAVSDNDPNAGVRYVIFENEDFKFNTDVGIKISNPLEVFTKARGRYTVPFENWELRLSDTLEWSSDDGVSDKADMTWSLPLKEQEALFKSVTAVIWKEDEDGVTGKQSFQYLKHISDISYWRFLVRGSWPEIPDVHETIYGGEVTYRLLVYSDWVYLELTPGIEFLEETDYGANPFIEVLFDFIFEEDKTTMGRDKH